MGVDEQRRRVLADDLELAVGLGLRSGEPVAVHVEAVEVPALADLAAVRVLDRQDHDDRVGEDLVDDAVVAGGELVEGVERGVGAALLAAVDVGRDPQDRRGVRGQVRGFLVGRRRILQRREPFLDPGEVGEVLRRPDDRVLDRRAETDFAASATDTRPRAPSTASR